MFSLRRQDQIVDVLVVLFAIWTLAAHAGFVFSASLYVTIGIAAFMGLAVLVFFRSFSTYLSKGIAPPIGGSNGCTTRLLGEGTRIIFLLLALMVVVGGQALKVPLAIIFVVIVILLLAGALHSNLGPFTICESTSEKFSRYTLFLAVLFGLSTLFLIRPDIDDSYHANVALNMFSNPNAPIMSKTSLVYGEPENFWLASVWRLQSLESLLAAFGILFSIEPIFFAHLLIPMIGAAIAIFSFSRLLRLLDPENWFWILLGVIVFFMSNGVNHESFGNFGGFVRLHQGKGIFLTAVTPLLVAYTLEFLKKPNWTSLALLVASQVAAVGLSSTALLLAPAIILITALAFSELPRVNVSLKTTSIALLSMAYPILIGLGAYYFMPQVLVHFGSGAPPLELVSDAWEKVIGVQPFLTISLFLLSTAWLFTDSPGLRRFCVLFPILSIVFFLNPLSAQVLTSSVISSWIYYRLVWSMQLPFICGVAMVLPFLYRPQSRSSFLFFGSLLVLFSSGTINPAWQLYSFWNEHLIWNIALLAMCAFLFWRNFGASQTTKVSIVFIGLIFFGATFPILNPKNVQLSLPKLKVQNPEYFVAKKINSLSSPSDVVLAPNEVSAWLPTMLGHATALLSRYNYYEHMTSVFPEGEAELRVRLLNTVSGRTKGLKAFELLRTALEKYPLSVVCISAEATIPNKEQLLSSHYFQLVEQMDGFEIWRKQQT